MRIPSLAPAGPPDGPSFVLTIRGNRVNLEDVDGPIGSGPPAAMFVGTLHGRHCWAVDGTDSASGAEDGEFVDLMSMYGRVDEATWVAAGRAVQLVAWSRDHRFCGRCGTPTEESPKERARCCPSCKLLAFPRLAPAVITLVERPDGKALLARNAAWPTSMYSCLAGFVEPGESLEEALRREVREEVGLEVGALRYFASQPWPFPHSLMLGFHADYAGGDIACDAIEIADAGWYAADSLPDIPGPISIARRLIDDWVARCQRAR